jgi:hypothetical protein
LIGGAETPAPLAPSSTAASPCVISPRSCRSSKLAKRILELPSSILFQFTGAFLRATGQLASRQGRQRVGYVLDSRKLPSAFQGAL